MRIKRSVALEESSESSILQETTSVTRNMDMNEDGPCAKCARTTSTPPWDEFVAAFGRGDCGAARSPSRSGHVTRNLFTFSSHFSEGVVRGKSVPNRSSRNAPLWGRMISDESKTRTFRAIERWVEISARQRSP